MIRSVNRALAGGLMLALLLPAVGCQSGPRVEELQADSDRQQRMLQQTISQIRKGLDEVREQRDEARTRAHVATVELETARKELEFFEAEIRALRKISTTRGTELEQARIENGKLDVLHTEARDRARKLERELTSTRVAFEANEQLVAKLQRGESTVQGRIDSAEEKLARDRRAFEQERTAFRETVQAKDDEIAVLRERLIDGEGNGAEGVVVRTGSTGRKEYYDTPPARRTNRDDDVATNTTPDDPPTTPTENADATVAVVPPSPNVAETRAAESATAVTDASSGGNIRARSVPVAPPSFFERAKKASTKAVGQVSAVIEDPAENAGLLLQKEAMTLIAIVCGFPFFLFVLWRRSRRKAKARKTSARVAVDGRTANSRAIRSVATRAPTKRVDDSSRVGELAPSQDPISPANAGNIAATLDAVLGGDEESPSSTPNPTPAAAPSSGGDEDELLGDLKDIVSKGLS